MIVIFTTNVYSNWLGNEQFLTSQVSMVEFLSMAPVQK